MLTWRELCVVLLEGMIVGGGMAALSIWGVYDHSWAIIVGGVAGLGTVFMLLVT